jgi:hypothetical protein
MQGPPPWARVLAFLITLVRLALGTLLLSLALGLRLRFAILTRPRGGCRRRLHTGLVHAVRLSELTHLATVHACPSHRSLSALRVRFPCAEGYGPKGGALCHAL